MTVIEARTTGLWSRLADAWHFRRYYRVLLKELTLRRYRNTVLGPWWLILRPLVPLAILTVTFSYLVEVDTGGIPYPLFLIGGFIAWYLFQSTVTFMSRSLMWTRSLMRKMYLPKMIVPAASIGPPLIELGIVIVIFAGVAATYFFADGVADIHFAWRMLVAIPCLLLVLVLAVAVGAVVSVVALLARDIIFAIAWVLQFAMFLTPVVYPLSSLPAGVQWAFYVFNPMTGLVETTRWAVTGFGAFDPVWFAVTVAEVGVITLLCLTFFARAETYLSDIV